VRVLTEHVESAVVAGRIGRPAPIPGSPRRATLGERLETTFAADASEMFGDAEGHREGARQQEGDADDERHKADEER
jgi:hypothetical protein